MLMNRFEEEDSKIASIRMRDSIFLSIDDFVNLTLKQLSMPGFIGDWITFHNIWVSIKLLNRQRTPRSIYFTVEEMIKN